MALKGPLKKNIVDKPGEEACAIICLNSTPEVVCVAYSNGTIYHSVVLPLPEKEYDEVRTRKSSYKVTLLIIV